MMQLTHKQKEKGFFLNTARHTIIGFIIFLLTIFVLGSCVVKMPSGTDTMRFNLSQGGSQINMDSSLNYNTVYRLTVEPGSDAETTTADYDIVYQPTDALTIVSQGPNFIEFTLNDVGHQTITITATHKSDNAITKTVSLSLAVVVKTAFQKDIENTSTVPDLNTASELTREVLRPLGAAAGATLVKIFVTESGTGNEDGSSWVNAWAAMNLRDGINAISNASANRVYLVMIAGGTYKPNYANPGDRSDSFGMKNRVAIMGGFQVGGGWARTGTTIFSGDIGAVGNNTDNSYHVFSHNIIALGNSHLYGAIITDGNADYYDISGTTLLGGGMYNYASSPVITRVVFSNNSARKRGGGMYNVLSFPVLTEIVFTGNDAKYGGGMYNDASSPTLTNTVFSKNSSQNEGGGIYNVKSSPILYNTVFDGNNADNGGGMFSRLSSSSIIIKAVFSGNSAIRDGGGMYNHSLSSPIIVGSVFRNNTAQNGGGINNNSDSQAGPLIVNTIFFNNTVNSGAGGVGPDIAVNLNGGGGTGGAETIRIAGSVLGIGLPGSAQPTNAIIGYDGSVPLNISNYSLANGAVNFGADATLTVNGMNFPYPTITAGSSAINLGLYVRRDGSTNYFSEDNATWYSSFNATGGWGSTATPSATAIDLTATDIAGNARSERPDAGVHELQ